MIQTCVKLCTKKICNFLIFEYQSLIKKVPMHLQGNIEFRQEDQCLRNSTLERSHLELWKGHPFFGSLVDNVLGSACELNGPPSGHCHHCLRPRARAYSVYEWRSGTRDNERSGRLHAASTMMLQWERPCKCSDSEAFRNTNGLDVRTEFLDTLEFLATILTYVSAWIFQ